MSFQGKLKQYLILVESLEKIPNQTLKELHNKLEEEGFNVAERTLQRHIEELRNEYGIEITCNRSFNTYSINKELSVNISFFVQFLQTAIQAQFVVTNIKDFKNISQYIHLSDSQAIKGIDLLEPLLKAIKEQKTINFIHENYLNGTHNPYEIQPYLLKEYLNRWYVVGFVPAEDCFLTFGLDRIKELNINRKKFIRKVNEDPNDFFENCIGLVFSEHPLQEVKIKATEHQAKYIRSQPLHKSQSEEPNYIFTYNLTPNYELMQRILMMGDQVTVLEPQWLIDEIKEILKKSLNNYN